MHSRIAPMQTRSPPPHGTSARLSRAAVAERAVLARKRDELASRSETLRSERHRIEIALIGLEERIALLDRLAELSALGPASPTANDAEKRSRLARMIPGGPAIREIAARALSPAAAPRDPVHSRRLHAIVMYVRAHLRAMGARDPQVP